MPSGLRPRFVLVYQDRRIPLPDGELVIGRGIGCHIRLNAESVSRQHLKLLVRGGRLLVENLSTTTGTLVNGARLVGSRSLGHGDRIQLGPRHLSIEVEDFAGAPPAVDTTADPSQEGSGEHEVGRPRRARASSESGEHAAEYEETTMTDLADRLVGTSPLMPPSIDVHDCPKCRARVAFNEGQCSRCGYTWAADHPSAVTSRVTLRDVARTPAPPPPVAAAPGTVPVVYASDELSIDAAVERLSLDGAFVPSELLDPVGTACELTLLPDGMFAMSLTGTVTEVRAQADARGPAGMAVVFAEVPPGARAWLERWLAGKP